MSQFSILADTLIPSEIIRIGNEINESIRKGNKIYNFTIGDFDPSIFPIPKLLEEHIINAYKHGKTNYPPAQGIQELRDAVSKFISYSQGLHYSASEILISGGGRPLIYAAYRTVCDKGEKIIYPVPSWNNNHYTHFVEGNHCPIMTSPDNNFLPLAKDIIPHLEGASLLALCSPLNPTGTVFSKEQLSSICEAVIAENKKRSKNQKPLYILYDQIYHTLTFNDTQHLDPVSLFPELKPFTIYIDGISKAFCATGVRVGWSFGPSGVIDKMKGILSHIGAWSPMAEQVANAKFLQDEEVVQEYLTATKSAILSRLEKIYIGFSSLKAKGFNVDAIPPMAAMYLTVRISIKGKKYNQNTLSTTQEATKYLLEEAKLGLVPFSAFGAEPESDWYRLSVGTCHEDEIEVMFDLLESALAKLK